MRLHFVHIQVGVADEDEQAWCEVVVAYDICILLLELSDGGVAAGTDVFVDGGKVSGALLELAGTCGNEVFHRKWVGEVGDKEGGLRDVKWESGLHTMCHVKGGVASRFADCGAVSPEGKGGDHGPT